MEVSTTLLLALLFVGLLSLGIVNLLMNLAGSFKERKTIEFYWVHSTWLALLLLVYLTIFWQAVAIFEVERWGFAGLLYVITGPVLLLFAAEVLSPPAERNADRKGYYFDVARTFFLFLAAEQVWLVGMQLILDGSLESSSLPNAFGFVLALALATSSKPKVHEAGAVVGIVFFIVATAYRGLF